MELNQLGDRNSELLLVSRNSPHLPPSMRNKSSVLTASMSSLGAPPSQHLDASATLKLIGSYRSRA